VRIAFQTRTGARYHNYACVKCGRTCCQRCAWRLRRGETPHQAIVQAPLAFGDATRPVQAEAAVRPAGEIPTGWLTVFHVGLADGSEPVSIRFDDSLGSMVMRNQADLQEDSADLLGAIAPKANEQFVMGRWPARVGARQLLDGDTPATLELQPLATI
jgi:hypothetical protein